MAGKNEKPQKEAPKERVKVMNFDFSGSEGLLPIIFKTAGHLGQEIGHVVRISFPARPVKKPENQPEEASVQAKEPEKHLHLPIQLSMLRQLCSPEKIRIIQAIRHEKPVSVYGLARKLGRGFKAVRQDLELLRHFGIVALVKESEKNSKRQRLRPVLALNKLQLNLQL